MQMSRALGVLSVSMMFIMWSSALAQNQIPDPVNRTYAITNARIVVSPGNVIDRGNVVLRDGKIESVGPNVVVPRDAQIIEGDSLWIYPGFIDGLSHVGIPEPTSTQAPPRVDDPGNATYERIGVRPQVTASSLIASDDKSVTTLRELGFTTAHVVPRGALFPGQGSIVLLGGRNPAEMVLIPTASFYGRLAGAPRGQGQSVYPSNILGVMAYWRELFLDAETARKQLNAYSNHPQIIERPSRNPELEALFPALDRKLPVFIETTSDRNVRRAHRLSTELGFDLVVAGLEDATTVSGFLQENSIPTVLSLALPEDKNKLDGDSTLAGMIPIRRTVGPADLENERQQLKIRAHHALETRRSHASKLHNAGVKFSFSTMGVKPGDIQTNLRLLIQNGLSEENALAALTTNPAALLGVENQMGTVSAGMMANLVLTNGNYFEKNTKVVQVFVDGRQYKPETAAPAAPRGRNRPNR